MESLENVRSLALDLRTAYPRSPRETLAGYVLAARIVDKARASVLDQLGDYHYGQPDSLDSLFFEFTGLDPDALKTLVATGANDPAIETWIYSNARLCPRIEIIKWNNRMRDLRLSEAPDFYQEYMEDYIRERVPKHRPVYVCFDIYDLEEGRL